MDLSIKVEVPPTALFQGRGSQIVTEELIAATEYAVNTIQGAVVPLTPVNLGTARAGWQTRVDVTGGGVDVLGRVFNPVSHALPLEAGSKPHWPPIAPIILWAKRKFSLADKEARAVGFLVARAISRRGTPAREMAKRAVAQVSGAVQARYQAALARITERLGR